MQNLKSNLSPKGYLNEVLAESVRVKCSFINSCSEELINVARVIASSIRLGGKVICAGNGGSSSDSCHLAGEMIGRLLVERNPLPAMSITCDSAVMTAVANDYGYESVFERQILGLAKPEDVFFAISTSGNSENIIQGVRAARKVGCKVVALTGGTGGKLSNISDYVLCVSDGENSCRIQETHIFIIHCLVDLLDRFFLNERVGP